jgi:hypothetical protein
MKSSVVYLFTASLFLFACRNDKGPLPLTSLINLSECDTSGYYVDDIAPMMTSKCATSGCHDAGSSSGDFTTYIGVKAKVDNGSMKNRVLDIKNMPPAGNPVLTQTELKRLDCWIKKGGLNSAKNPAAATVNACATTISYSVTVTPIVSANCSSSGACHGVSSANGDYTSYAGLKTDADNGKLNNRVIVNNNTHNPPAFVPALSSADKDKINCWIQQNSPNN